ncbi:flagellar basal body P-ring protein FlgI [bacterium]|jgi:flagellar P-ring protein precursor FlgI|nr:flagellar basal body P-ring protein FlgI [bacterium]
MSTKYVSFNRIFLVLAAMLALASHGLAMTTVGARLKDIAAVKGVRENILIGYGIVVGLKGTGDSSTDVTAKSLGRLFGKLGLDVEKNAAVKSKNAAAVIVTAKLPAFARSGTLIDITVSSIGDAGSLEGGTLLVTPLRAGDQQVYAVAQGQVTLGGLADGKSIFPTVGRIVSGATVERDVDTNFAGKKSFRMSLNNPDFTTAARVVALINSELGGKFASARDSATIDIVVPFNYDGNSVDLMARIENIRIVTDSKAKVVLNERTGTVVMGDKVSIAPVAISHGDLSIEVKGAKPNRILEVRPGVRADVAIGLQNGNATVADLVKLLNTLGVAPKDMTAIFQTIKATGALQAELEMI